MGNETDELLGLPEAVGSSRPGREIDMLITGGERKAAALLGLASKTWAYLPIASPALRLG
jgi:aspartate kinase